MPSHQPDASFKAFAYEEMARFGKAMSSPQRLVLMNILVNGSHTVDELASLSGLAVANTSRHLQVLKRARLVTAKNAGKRRRYSIASIRVKAFFIELRDLATDHLAELRQALNSVSEAPSRLHSVGRDELVQLVGSGEAVVLDVRPASEFEESHLPGAVSLPVEETLQRLDELPKNKEIVAYCRGRFCLLADTAVTLLRQAGYQVRRTDEDAVTWDLAGLAVVRAEDPNSIEEATP